MPEGDLFVPMRSLSDNQLQGGQVIAGTRPRCKWDKKMLPGMRAKGAVLRLGPPKAREACLCEGYATGLSIELAARQARLSVVVIVTFSDSNLVHVAGLLKDSSMRRFVFADNDKSGAGERAAKDAGLPYCMSDKQGEDANDVHARAGLMAVQKLLMQARGGHVP
jgi:putative DNA primase/helicase